MSAPADPGPGYKRLLIYGDETGTTGPQYQGYGSIWLPWERRGDFVKVIREQRSIHNYEGGIAAALGKTDGEAFALGLIDEVFRRRWISFRCVITPSTDQEELTRLAFAALIRRRLESLPLSGKEVRLRLSKAARVASRGSVTPLAQIERLVTPALTDDVERSIAPARGLAALEVVELLTSLVVGDWEKKNTSLQRRKLSDRVAENLGWKDLAADTEPLEWKFNIWWLEDPRAAAPREKPHRSVQLRLPMID